MKISDEDQTMARDGNKHQACKTRRCKVPFEATKNYLVYRWKSKGKGTPRSSALSIRCVLQATTATSRNKGHLYEVLHGQIRVKIMKSLRNKTRGRFASFWSLPEAQMPDGCEVMCHSKITLQQCKGPEMSFRRDECDGPIDKPLNTREAIPKLTIAGGRDSAGSQSSR